MSYLLYRIGLLLVGISIFFALQLIGKKLYFKDDPTKEVIYYLFFIIVVFVICGLISPYQT